jgi:hypothetical protein
MKYLGLVLLLLCSFSFAEDKPTRLDMLKDVKINCVNFVASQGGWSLDKGIEGKQEVSVEVLFPKVYTVVKIELDSIDMTIIRNVDQLKAPSLYNFEIFKRNETYKDYQSVNKYQQNSNYHIELKQKFKTDGVKICLDPVYPGREYRFGAIAKLAIWGYEGEEPKKVKVTKDSIKNKADAKEAYRSGVITSKEYLELQKKLKE